MSDSHRVLVSLRQVISVNFMITIMCIEDYKIVVTSLSKATKCKRKPQVHRVLS